MLSLPTILSLFVFSSSVLPSIRAAPVDQSTTTQPLVPFFPVFPTFTATTSTTSTPDSPVKREAKTNPYIPYYPFRPTFSPEWTTSTTIAFTPSTPSYIGISTSSSSSPSSTSTIPPPYAAAATTIAPSQPTTCFTLTITTHAASCAPLTRACAIPDCIIESILPVSCGCSTIPTATVYTPCPTACDAGCGTAYNMLYSPCAMTSASPVVVSPFQSVSSGAAASVTPVVGTVTGTVASSIVIWPVQSVSSVAASSLGTGTPAATTTGFAAPTVAEALGGATASTAYYY